jgi:dephospho-CoA kinase
LFHNKPIIGITGGIGGGKSTVAGMFGELGCCVIDSDEQVRQAYSEPAIVRKLREWWGDDAFEAGRVSRKKIGRIVFADRGQLDRLEKLLHRRVAELRDQVMDRVGNDPKVPAFVWDTPLLFETGLSARCDAIVFVEASAEVRLNRVKASRGWDEGELRKREILQWPLDKKREISHYIVDNTADADDVRGQVREILFRILARLTPHDGPMNGL